MMMMRHTPLPMQVIALANWLEIAKMNSSLTSNLLGGPILADMLAYINSAVAARNSSEPTYYKLVTMSAHYNTLVRAELGRLIAPRTLLLLQRPA